MMEHKRYCMIFDMPDCTDGVEYDNLEAAKADALDTLVEWAVQTVMKYGEDNIEEWNYMIYNFSTWVAEWDDEKKEYVDIWYPSEEDLKLIGIVEK